MKLFALVFMLVVLNLSLVFGGEIYGTIKEQGRPIKSGVKVEIATKTGSIEATTDENGSYSIYLEEQGEFVLKVHCHDQTPSIVVFSFQDPVRYDLAIKRSDGQYYLERE